MKLSDKGLNLITSFEGISLKPYPDSAGIATIGYGTILYPNGQSVKMTDPEITQDQAAAFLEHEVNLKTAGVAKCIAVPVNQNQFDALVCFAYNVGTGALSKSTLLKLLNSGNVSAAAEEFLKWNKAGGQIIPGLTRRRQAERSLFLQPMSTDQLDSGPSDEEINSKLANIEKDLK